MEAATLNQEVLAFARIGKWEWDVANDAMSWSPEMYEIFEVSPNHVLAPSDIARFRSVAADGIDEKILRHALRSGAPWRSVHPAVTAQGREIWVRSIGHVEQANGLTLRIFGLVQDVTDQHNAKRELEKYRGLLEEISAISGIGGWEYDADSKRVQWSPETRRIFEVEDAFTPTLESLAAFFAPGALEIQGNSIQRAAGQGVPSDCEYGAVTAKGRNIRVRSVCRAEQRDGRITRLVGTIQDVTRHRDLEQTLGRTERLLGDISRLTGVGGWEIDLKTGRTLWTDETRRIFDVDHAFEPTEEAFGRFLPPDAYALIRTSVRDARHDGRSFDIEFDAFTSGGSPMRLRSVGHPEQVDSCIVRVIGTLENVTGLRRAEADRHRQEALHEQVARLSGIGGWEFDLRTQETTWSPQVRKIYEVAEGYNPPLEDHSKFVAPESAEIVALARRRAVVEGLPAELDFQAITATGRRIWVRNIYQAERINGRSVRLFGTAQDVTVARAAQADMELLHTRLKIAIEAAELRVWEVDLETGVMQWDSLQPLTFAGSEMASALGASAVLDFIHPEDREAFSQQTREVVLSDTPSVSRVRARAPDGTFRHVEVRMCLSSRYVDRRKIIGVSRDVTRDVTLNNELVQKQREAEDSSLAKSQFVARMSHEIRTPMSGVIGMLEVLQRTEVDPVKRTHAATALKSARDLMSVLDDIIDVSQLESRHLSLDNEPFSLAAVVEDVVTLFGALARDKSLALTAEASTSLPAWVMGDRRRVRQVLTNLVGNAVKFTASGAVRVSVSYDSQCELAHFAVQDTGEGISTEIVDKIFDQFFQADSSATRRHGGSGLGLAISKQLVGMMGGEIYVVSKLGVGSTFHFSVEAPLSSSPRPAAQKPQTGPAESLRILVAEDNPAMQRVLRALLEAGGHELTLVSDGRDAVARAATGTFDVILMDVMMPIMDGPTATQRIRELGGRAGGVPIIALTANALLGDRDRYLEVGMTDYLAKPIEVAALFEALARVASRS